MNHSSTLANKKLVPINRNTIQKSSTSTSNIHTVKQFGDFSWFPRNGSNNADSITGSPDNLHLNKQNTLKRYRDNTIDDYFKCKRSYFDETRYKKLKIISRASTSDEDDTICFSAIRTAKNREINKTSFNNYRESDISNGRVFKNDDVVCNDDLLAYITSQEENNEFVTSPHYDRSNIRQKHYIDHNKNIQLPPINSTHGTNYQKLLEDDLDFFESLTKSNDNKFIDLLCSINRDCEKVSPSRVTNELPLDLFLQNFNSNHHSQPVLCHKCGSEVYSNNIQKEYKFKYVREIEEDNEMIASTSKYQGTDSGNITQNNFWLDVDCNRIKQQSEHSSSVLQTLGESNNPQSNRKDDFICLQSLAFAGNEPGLLNYSISSSNSTNFTQMKRTHSSQVIENSICKTQDEIGSFHKMNSLLSTQSSSLFTTQETPNSSSQIMKKSSPVLDFNGKIEISDLKVVNQSYDLNKYETFERTSREVVENSTLKNLKSIADENPNKSTLYSAQFSTKFDSSSPINIDLNKEQTEENLETNKIRILQNFVLDNALINHCRNIPVPNKPIQTLETRVLRDINSRTLNQDAPKAKNSIPSSSNVKETQILTKTKSVENVSFNSKVSCKSQKENDYQNDVNNLKEFLTEKMQDIGQYLLKNQNQENASTLWKRRTSKKLENVIGTMSDLEHEGDRIKCVECDNYYTCTIRWKCQYYLESIKYYSAIRGNSPHCTGTCLSLPALVIGDVGNSITNLILNSNLNHPDDEILLKNLESQDVFSQPVTFVPSLVNRANLKCSQTSNENTKRTLHPTGEMLVKAIDGFSKDDTLISTGNYDVTIPENVKKLFILRKISDVFMKLLNDIENGYIPTLCTVDQTKWNNCTFDEYKMILRPVETPLKKYTRLKNGNSRNKFKLIILLMGKIVSLLINNSTCTKRELYYQIKLNNFVKFQNEINIAVDLISCIIDEPPWDFGILATQKGLVYGDLKIILSENEIINCNIPGGSLVPQDQRTITKVESDASFILIVEKDSVFQKLLDEDLPNRLPRTFIMITGKGYLDISTRLFVKKLWQILKIPVFALVDADPCGIEIMLTYRFGSLALCHLSRYLALPSLRWIGIHPSEIISLNINREPLTKRDQNKIRSLLTRPYMHFVPKIKEELELMLKKDFKAQIEGVMKSENYMRNFYIPSKLCAQDFI